MSFTKFCELFPNAKFAKIKKFDEIELSNQNARREAKKPLNRWKTQPLNVEKAKEWIEQGGRVGWIVPKDYIVIDVDNNDHPKSAYMLYKILSTQKVKFWMNKTNKGSHFIFKNISNALEKVEFAGHLTILGIRIDGRGNENGYIILPENDNEFRGWTDWANEDIDDLPYYLRPLRLAKESDPIFIDMPNGSGNDAMIKMRGIATRNNAMTDKQAVEALWLVNTLIWDTPMSRKEFESSVGGDKPTWENSKKADGTGKKEKKKKRNPLSPDENDPNPMRVIAQRLIRDEKLVSRASYIYKYDAGQYRRFKEHELQKFILEKGYLDATSSERKEITNFICAFSQRDDSEFNTDENYIAVKNGAVDLYNMKLLPHSDEYLNTIKLSHLEYNENVEYNETIDTFMKNLAMGDERKMRFLYEVAGYCLLKKNKFSKFFIFYGGGGTGKSTFSNLISKMVGSEYTANVKLNQFDQDYYLATLTDKLVNIDYDASDKKMLDDSGRFKSIVCSEPVLVRQIYETPTELTSCATIIINTNHLPKINDKSDGMLRRMVLVKLDQKIKNKDPNFMDRIGKLEMEYFLVKAVEAISRVLHKGEFSISESEDDLLKRFKLAQSNVRKWLEEKQIDIAYLNGKSVANAYSEYKTFCMERNYGLTQMMNFKDEIEEITDLTIDLDEEAIVNGQRVEMFCRWEDDPRDENTIFVPRISKSRLKKPGGWGKKDE